MADAEYARFETMTNVELRTELKRRNCSTTGNKKDLLAKLRAALQKQYEQQTSVGYTLNETPVNTIHDQISHPVISIPSIDSQTNEQTVLETSNNVEINSFEKISIYHLLAVVVVPSQSLLLKK
jgi:hypothetical protein